MKLSRVEIKAITIGLASLISMPAPAAKFYCDNQNIIAVAEETSLLGEVVNSKKN